MPDPLDQRILFGPAGTPETAPAESTEAGLRETARLKLDTMEIEFVQGVRTGPEKAAKIGALARELALPLSVHAPYYVNLAAKEPEKIEASIKRILDSARIGSLCGADRVVFHAGFFMNRDPESVHEMILRNVLLIRDTMKTEGLASVQLRPELTGKASQFGSPEELIRLCSETEGVLPCVDFSHLYARTQGEINTYDSFSALLERLGSALGDTALHDMHIHLSGIEFTKAGERRHLNIAESQINWRAVLKALHAFGARGRIICESPDRAHDAGLFKKYWSRCLASAAKDCD